MKIPLVNLTSSANKFAEWLDTTKQKLTNNRYRLEDQRDLIESKHEEIKKKRAVLREIEVSFKILNFKYPKYLSCLQKNWFYFIVCCENIHCIERKQISFLLLNLIYFVYCSRIFRSIKSKKVKHNLVPNQRDKMMLAISSENFSRTTPVKSKCN